MDRRELVLHLVLSQLADDYECLETVLRCLQREERVSLTSAEVQDLLISFVRTEFAKVYWYSDPLQEFEEMQRIPTAAEMEDVDHCYFYITERGKAVLNDFPNVFDDEGKVVPNWRDL